MDNRFNDERFVYFHIGDKVKLKKDLTNSPKEMLVSRVLKQVVEKGGAKQLVGIKVLWFDDTKAPHEQVFNSKDLMHIV